MTHSRTLAWKITWMEEPSSLQSMGSLTETTEWLHFHFSLSCIGKGNGNPLQCPCLENPRDGRAWWDAVYGVAQSRTRLKRMSSSSSRAKGKNKSAYSRLLWLFPRENYAVWIIFLTFHQSTQCLKQVSVSAYARSHAFQGKWKEFAEVKHVVFALILDNCCVPTLWLLFSDFNAFQFPNG